jgi:leucyl aminopeptidase
VLNVRLSDRPMTAAPDVVVLPVCPGSDSAALVETSAPIEDDLRAEVEAFLIDAEHKGTPGALATLPRPGRTPRRVLLVGVGDGGEAGWRTAGAAIARAAGTATALWIAMPATDDAESAAAEIRGVSEGLWLASYKFRYGDRRKAAPDAVVDTSPDDELRQVTLMVGDVDAQTGTVADAFTIASATRFARDLTNTPSADKTPEWFADQISSIAAGNPDLTIRVRAADELAEDGFGGILAVGRGSSRGPRLVELSWAPEGATHHVVLVGKGITFDTGGICIKPADGMLLMRKDMGGAAAIMAATLGAAEMKLPVRITALAPLAENMISGGAFRPGDVVRHYGGVTSEIMNTDAEGRVVLGDALAYAAEQFQADYLIDLATLTGANMVALGKRTGALYTENDELADSLARSATEAGERVWRMPMPEDYVKDIRSEIADVANSGPGPGSVTAALFLREFTGALRPRWAHIDMSAPSWAASADAELAKGATGWGVRTLLRWLESLSS